MTVVGDRSTRRLWSLYAAVAVSALGDGVFAAAIPLAAAALTRDPVAVAVVGAAEMLPWLFVSPFAGALVDRWPHRRVMIVSDAARALLLAGLALLVACGMGSVTAIAITAALVMIGYTFHNTAQQHVVADMTERDPDRLHEANGRVSAATTAGRSLIGPPVGSATFAWLAWIPFAANAASFALSAALVFLLPRDAPSTAAPGGHEPILRSIGSGVKWLARHRLLRALCALVVVGNISYAGALSTFVLYAQDVLGVSTAAYGLMLSAGAVGGIVISLSAKRIIGFLGEMRTLLVALTVQVLAWAAIAAVPLAAVAGCALALASAGTGLAGVVVVGARQRLAPPAMLGRVVSTFRTLGVGALPLGATLGGAVAASTDLRTPLWLAGGILAVAVAASARLLLTTRDAPIA
ncbi:MFS transporter [Longispora albida]|uniref:MFS transporter n=1 Tax=Longispora albida TaxID=203523 RepID=UPI00039F7B3F|nr:MFS transporter [Longispora albida]